MQPIWTYASLAGNIFQDLDYSDIFTKVLVGFLLGLLSAAAGHTWKASRSLWRRILNRDAYASLYGKWKVYRVTSIGLIDTEVEIKKRLFTDIPKCIFHTRYVGNGIKSKGYCRLYGSNLFIHIAGPDVAPSEGTHNGDFVYVIKHDGFQEFTAIKYGLCCGVIADGKIAGADVLMSKEALDPTFAEAQLTTTRLIDAATAFRFVSKIKTLPEKTAPEPMPQQITK